MKLRTTAKIATVAAMAGGAAVYFSDPERGARRRHQVQERIRQLTERPAPDDARDRTGPGSDDAEQLRPDAAGNPVPVPDRRAS